MSDLMLHGILNAPCDIDDPIGVTQLKSAAKRASCKISNQEKKIAQLEADKAELIDALDSAMCIKSIWVPMGSFSDDPPENYQEMEALHLMDRNFDRLLQKHKEQK